MGMQKVRIYKASERARWSEMTCMFRRFYEFATKKKLECKNDECELYGVDRFCNKDVKKKKRGQRNDTQRINERSGYA